MTSEIRTAPIPEEGAEFGNIASGDDPCYICGERTTGAYAICVVDGGGTAVHVDDADLPEVVNDAGYMGWHSVGSSCKSKLPAGYVYERPEPEFNGRETFTVSGVRNYGWYRSTESRDVEFETRELYAGGPLVARSVEPVALATTKTGSKVYERHLTGTVKDDGELAGVEIETGRFDYFWKGWNEAAFTEGE